MVGPSPRAQESGPAESRALCERVEMLQGLLERLRQQVARQAWARARARARQSVLQESRRLLQQAEAIQAQLCREEQGVDVASAQRLLAEHQDLLEDVHLRQERSGPRGAQGALQTGQGRGDGPPEREREETVGRPPAGVQAGVQHDAEAGLQGGKR